MPFALVGQYRGRKCLSYAFIQFEYCRCSMKTMDIQKEKIFIKSKKRLRKLIDGWTNESASRNFESLT